MVVGMVIGVVGIGVAVLALALGSAFLRSAGFSASVSRVHTGDNTIDEFGYSQNLRADLGAINQAAQGLHPACDGGSHPQQCLAADATMIATLDGVLDRLRHTSVPTRYAVPQARLVAALEMASHAFSLRNRAIAAQDQTHGMVADTQIREAQQAITIALGTYPAGTVLDNG
jgi:hypothetical protein